MDINKIFLSLVIFTVLSLSVVLPTSFFKTSYGTVFEQEIGQQAEQVAVGEDIDQNIDQSASQSAEN